MCVCVIVQGEEQVALANQDNKTNLTVHLIYLLHVIQYFLKKK